MTRLVLCSHGTRSEVGAARITALVAAVAAALPSVEVREAHVDVHPPYLDEVVTPGSVVVPLLLAPGYHVDTDIGGAALAAGATVAPALGPDGLLTSLLLARLKALARPLGRRRRRRARRGRVVGRAARSGRPARSRTSCRRGSAAPCTSGTAPPALPGSTIWSRACARNIPVAGSSPRRTCWLRGTSTTASSPAAPTTSPTPLLDEDRRTVGWSSSSYAATSTGGSPPRSSSRRARYSPRPVSRHTFTPAERGRGGTA